MIISIDIFRADNVQKPLAVGIAVAVDNINRC